MSEALKFTNHNGQLHAARMHDARLISLRFDWNERVILKFQRVDGTKAAVHFEEVREYYFGPLFQGPIILDTWLWRVSEVPKSDMVDVGWNALFRGYLNPHDIPQEAKKIISRDPGQLLAVVGYLHGTSMAFVCKDLVIANLQ